MSSNLVRPLLKSPSVSSTPICEAGADGVLAKGDIAWTFQSLVSPLLGKACPARRMTPAAQHFDVHGQAENMKSVQ
eukprot:4247818-Amphidinium_carterae.1